ncbi:MAG TPA: flagellar hook-basal body complex protein FliE [Candidatus Acidoferrum sp.]|nr:flagellar hook-basal body complex protein FliE [Candidatus Acidoferrum sp.]
MNNAIPGFSPIPSSLNPGSSAAPSSPGAGANDFMSTLQNAMEQVGDLQSEADSKVAQLLTGNGQDVHSTMIAVQKANLAFEMMVQVRNKILAAYQQVSNLPL